MLLSDPRHAAMMQQLSPGQPDPSRPCQLCQGPTEHGACPRCGAALCMEHLPARGRRCLGCEAHHRQVAHGIRRWWWLMLAVVPWAAFVTFVVLDWGSSDMGKTHFSPVVDMLIFVIGSAVIWFGPLAGVAATWRRRRFLRERAE